MAKVKYYYDSENLAYKKITTKNRTKLGFAILFLVVSALSGSLVFLLLINTSYFKTPKDRFQAREIENLKVRYAILNKKMDEINDVTEAIQNRDNNIYRVYFNRSGIPDSIRKEGFKDLKRYKDLEGYNNSKLVISTTKRIDQLAKQLAVQSQSLDEILKLASTKKNLLLAIPAIQPVSNENLKRMASGFGYRIDPFTKVRKMHNGMDFAANTGSPVYATGEGVVARADNSASGYGNHIVIRHGFGYESLYAHLSKYNCRRGQQVKRGSIIGYVGSTGRSEGPHCHYEVHKDGKVVNPLNFYYGNMSAEEYVAISKLASQENQSLD